MTLDIQTLGFDTRSIHAGSTPDPTTGARATPIYQTTSYTFENVAHAAALFNLEKLGYIYTRLTNPTNRGFTRTNGQSGRRRRSGGHVLWSRGSIIGPLCLVESGATNLSPPISSTAVPLTNLARVFRVLSAGKPFSSTGSTRKTFDAP